jgi:hypothetical protein
MGGEQTYGKGADDWSVWRWRTKVVPLLMPFLDRLGGCQKLFVDLAADFEGE